MKSLKALLKQNAEIFEENLVLTLPGAKESFPTSLSMVAPSMVALSTAGEPSEISAMGPPIYHAEISPSTLCTLPLVFSGIWKVDFNFYPQRLKRLRI